MENIGVVCVISLSRLLKAFWFDFLRGWGRLKEFIEERPIRSVNCVTCANECCLRDPLARFESTRISPWKSCYPVRSGKMNACWENEDVLDHTIPDTKGPKDFMSCVSCSWLF